MHSLCIYRPMHRSMHMPRPQIARFAGRILPSHRCTASTAARCELFNTKSIIFNTKSIIFIAVFILCDAQLIICNAEFHHFNEQSSLCASFFPANINSGTYILESGFLCDATYLVVRFWPGGATVAGAKMTNFESKSMNFASKTMIFVF